MSTEFNDDDDLGHSLCVEKNKEFMEYMRTGDTLGEKKDFGKPRMSLLPFDALMEVAKVLEFGAQKYSPDNWKKVPNGFERYSDALLRHYAESQNLEIDQTEWSEEDDLDEESGLLSLAHLACNALFILHFKLKEREAKRNKVKETIPPSFEVKVNYNNSSESEIFTGVTDIYSDQSSLRLKLGYTSTKCIPLNTISNYSMMKA